MLRRRKFAILGSLSIVVITFFTFLGVYLLVPNRSLAEQRRYEKSLLGKNLKQAEVILEGKPYLHVTRAQTIADHGACHWPAGEEAVAHWYKDPTVDCDVVGVAFNEDGIVTRVKFQSSFSFQLRRWLPFIF